MIVSGFPACELCTSLGAYNYNLIESLGEQDI